MDNISSSLLHFGVNKFHEIEVRVLLFDILIKFFIINFVSFLEFAVIRQIFLDSVVGKMNASVADF